MNQSISLSTNSSLSLSTSRVAKMLSHDAQEATKLNIFDKFLDLFRPQSKEAALQHLHTMLHSKGLDNFARFNLLSQLSEPTSRALFTVHIAENAENSDKFTIEYSINGETIKTDTINAHERDVIHRQMGKPLDTSMLREQVSTIDQHRINTQSLVATVLDTDFSGGGVNKKFHAPSGLLRAENSTGREDFDRELVLSNYAESKPELACYISTQKKVTDASALHPALDTTHAYAVVDTYDAAHVTSQEMDRCLASLSREQARSLLPQLVDMTRVLYTNKVAHRDLHMHNLVVHEVKETHSVHLKAIDFGRLALGADFEPKKFEDIDYLFNKQGATAIETIGRNYFARAGSEVDMKHYPIHKLCERFNDRGIALDPALSRIGEYLKQDLAYAGEDEALINTAFEKASQTLQQCFAQLQSTGDLQGITFA